MKVTKSVTFNTDNKKDMLLLDFIDNGNNFSGTVKDILFKNISNDKYKDRSSVKMVIREKTPKEKLYSVWRNMKERCTNVNHKSYKDYGGRGLKICERWLDPVNFYNDVYESFIDHVFQYGIKNTTLERMDNDKGYSEENCCWATYKIQENNKRRIGKKPKVRQ